MRKRACCVHILLHRWKNWLCINSGDVAFPAGINLLLIITTISACKQSAYTPPEHPLFVKMSPDQTGIDFRNDIRDDSIFNEITYRNFYNGGGVAVGDVNNDGLPDVFMTANQGKNQLYLNKGNFKFADITIKAGINKNHQWSTGVTMADVNGDGLLDIYICTAGNLKGDKRLNELYINQGNLSFKEQAAAYNLQDSGAFHTQAAFFDYDLDGDLDAYLLNNNCLVPVGSYGFGEARKIDSPIDGDKLMRNDNGVFTDVSSEAGIFKSSFGFGLGVTVGDINADNWPDLYISNDFFEKDYLYINQQNGSFREMSDSCIAHMSQSSMGADMADINNDGLIDIFSTDMLPEDDYRLKKNTAFEDYDTYSSKGRVGFHRQLLSNMLHLNNGDNTFSEIAQFAGVDATDWSWGALVFDLDNDGWKDIMVCNGMYLDVTDQDYIVYTADRDNATFFQQNKERSSYELLKKMLVSQPIANYAFLNQRDLRFTNEAYKLGLGEPGFSNGAAYADFDNDGDLDLILNNLNDECSVFRNTSDQQKKNFVKIALEGEGKNKFGVGAVVTVYTNGMQQSIQNFPTRGFQSCVEHVLTFGLGGATVVDSVRVVWPNQRMEVVRNVKPNQTLAVAEVKATLPALPATKPNTLFANITPEVLPTGIRHTENSFVDFDQQRLIPHLLSTEGPKVSVADVNGDGLEDFFMASAKHDTAKILVQQPSGKFLLAPQPAFLADKGYEDAGSCFIDIDKDGDHDLIVASGGNLEQPGSEFLQVRLYLNNGKGQFTRASAAIPDVRVNASCVRACDFDNDGDEDIFIGGRSIPLVYGAVPESFLLRNDNGSLKDVTAETAAALKEIGMVTDAAWADFDNNGTKELIVVGEWMPVTKFRYDAARKVFSAQVISQSSGWWNCIRAIDIDNDGDMDFLAGNLGLNSKIRGDSLRPARLYVSDFDDNGRQECIVSLFKKDGKEYVYYMRPDLTTQLPALKKKFLQYASYAGKTVHETLTPEQLKKSKRNDAQEFRSCVFLNDGNGNFTKQPLPPRAQFSPIYAFHVVDINNDGKKDIMTGGNLHGLKPELGRYDADYGTTFLAKGGNTFEFVSPQRTGIFYLGQVRDMAEINTKQGVLLIVSRNNDVPLIFKKTAEKQ